MKSVGAQPRCRLLSLLALSFVFPSASAHESRPIYIKLSETSTHSYLVEWKTPPSVPRFNTPIVALPPICVERSSIAELSGPDGIVRRMSYHCPQGLVGASLAITYPGPNPSVSSLIRFSTAAGERHLAVLGPQESSWSIPQAETASGVARQYTVLGIEHIWGGFDHLLFLASLLWIAGRWRRILITITGFTLAHSLTLVLAALEVVRLPVPPVEASIALSIVFVATEIAKGPRASLTWRYPIAVSSSFGLLHGFGFAAALQEIGLPQTELVTGLLFFNVGVEIGQVFFAVVTTGVVRLVQRLTEPSVASARREALMRSLVAYAVGLLAVFWFFERGAGFWAR